jgi:uncharacterized membrane protein YqiK
LNPSLLGSGALGSLVGADQNPDMVSKLFLGTGIVMGLLLLIVPSIKKADEWQRAIVLRLGKFHRIKGPGLFFLFPIIDRITRVVDIRIRVTDFSAQETLTQDSVTVTVDALCFWLVWDPQKTILEYEEVIHFNSNCFICFWRNCFCTRTVCFGDFYRGL